MVERTRGRFAESFSRLRRRAHIVRRDPSELTLDPDLPPRDTERLTAVLESVLAQREPATRRHMASTVLTGYGKLNEVGRRRFFELLADRLAPDGAAVDAAIKFVMTANTTVERVAAERELRRVLTPRYARLFHVLTGLPEGVKLLIDLRADLLTFRGDDPSLRRLDDELAGHLSTLFDAGLLELQHITWERSPAALLEKLIAYEAVHEIKGWDDLRRRLAPDRRCFAFFHPALPGEPLIFVEVALVEGLAGAVPPLLLQDGDEEVARLRAARADTAIFYSISNCQDGLRGVSFGNFLIKQVVEELQTELPRLQRFSTLSPIPGFRRWLTEQHGDGDTALLSKLASDRWWQDGELSGQLRNALMQRCAVYLTRRPSSGRIDPVARFHLGNGARLERINWLGNTAPRGICESFGIMVNYLYDHDQIETNHEAFVHGTIVRSAEVDALL
jgi:malonyl-CoA decarboxylase